jgi:hypothetical protein
MEMDLYKSQILDGVLMVLVQKQILQAHVSNCMARVSIFLVLNVHIPAYLGSRGKPFFGTHKFFVVSADRILVQNCILICIIQSRTCEITYEVAYKKGFKYKLMCTNLYIQIHTYKIV